MLSSADQLYGDADFIFQQDMAPAHTDKGTKSWFNDHGVTENLWDTLKRNMRNSGSKLKLNSAIDLMPHLNDAKRAPTKY